MSAGDENRIKREKWALEKFKEIASKRQILIERVSWKYEANKIDRSILVIKLHGEENQREIPVDHFPDLLSLSLEQLEKNLEDLVDFLSADILITTGDRK